MKDFATSSDPAVQAQLDRLAALSVPQGRLGLETIRALLARLGDPHKRLPPVLHIAGTNGKGSTCAFLRAMLEADGQRVHMTTSPHLVRYNERIRLAGELISDDRLAPLLVEVLDAGHGLAPSFFEVTIAAAFAEFARVPADVCVIEVGLGGRFDATNVIAVPAARAIPAPEIDHERFLLTPEEGTPQIPLARIAFEKAGIVKRGASLATLSYPPEAQAEIERAALGAGAPLAMRGRAWHSSTSDIGLHYVDRHGEVLLPLPTLPGAHQAENAALAVATLRHQDFITVSRNAMAEGIRNADWPARLQRLAPGALRSSGFADRPIWLDGGHNPSAGEALGRHFTGQRLHLIVGMLDAKDPRALTAPLLDSIASLTVVPVPGHECHPASVFGPSARAAPDEPTALAVLPDDGLPVLVSGSLYLAGEVLRLNGTLPD